MGAGSRKTTTGYKYHGGVAFAVCMGPVDTLWGIWNGDTEVYAGPIHRASADADGKTTLTTDLGTLKFYWGSDAQAQDADLAGLEIDYGAGPVAVPVPNWKGVCYAVSTRLEFGQQMVPPTLHFEVSRLPAVLSLSTHEIGGDAVIPEVIYEYFTNPVWGHGIPTSEMDTPAWIAACESVIAEGLGVSPTCDDTTTLREWVGKLLSYIDGVICRINGKISIRLIRKESTAGLITLTESDLLDEPEPSNEGIEATWNLTRIKFIDRLVKYEQAVEVYDDPANAEIAGETVPREFNMPYVRRRAVAKAIAKRTGIKGGLIPMSWRLQLKPAHKGITPGQRLFLSYAKLGITSRLVRVLEVGRGAPDKPDVDVEVVEELTRDVTADYMPPEDTFAVPARLYPDGSANPTLTSTTPRLAWLPTGLKEGKADGWLAACHRPDEATNNVSLYWTWDPTQWPYQKLDLAIGFPCKGEVQRWHGVRAGNWVLRVRFDAPGDYDRLLALLDSEPELYAVVGRRLVRTQGTTKSEHQLAAFWLRVTPSGYFDTVSADTIDIELTPGAWSSPSLALESLSSDQECPTVHVYLGGIDDFLIYRSDSIAFERPIANAPYSPMTGLSPDTGLIRHIKCPIGRPDQSQALSDVTATTYDRDNTAMGPDGTLSTEWGPRVPSSYETFDGLAGREVEGPAAGEFSSWIDIEEALADTLRGVPTERQYLLTEHIDIVLGAMATHGHLIHTNTP